MLELCKLSTLAKFTLVSSLCKEMRKVDTYLCRVRIKVGVDNMSLNIDCCPLTFTK